MNEKQTDKPADKRDVAAIVQIAQEALKPVHIDMALSDVLFIPPSPHEKSALLDLEKFREHPRRKHGNVTVYTVAALNTFMLQNRDAGDINVYVDANTLQPKIVAVLNDNGVNGPGFRDFRCAIEFRPTPNWVKWRKIDGVMMPQADFAEFVEENLADIYDPPGAQMLEIATFLQATRSVDFKSALNLSNGNVQFQNIESVDAKVSASQLTVPAEFTLALEPIQGAGEFKIPARFRYRLTEGKLRLGFKLLRIEDVMNDIIIRQVNDLLIGDGITLIYGAP
jgi:uncharacterized protein YfdQ (DUF2303 family)